MNLKHPYEKHLAEKLVQLPPPDDPDQNWQQMKGLLDKNMPRGGGGLAGSYRWWVAGTVIVAVLVGTWFGGRSLRSKEQGNAPVAGTIKTVNNKNNNSVASTENNVEQGSNSRSNNPGKDPRGAAYASTNDAKNNEAVTNDVVTNNTTNATNDVVSNNDIDDKARSSGNDNNAAGNNPTIDHNKTTVDRNKIYCSASKNDKVGTGNNSAAKNRNTGSHTRNTVTTANSRAVNNNNNKGGNNKAGKPVKRSAIVVNKPSNDDGSDAAESRYTRKPTNTVPSQPSTPLKESLVTHKVNYTAGLVVSPSAAIQQEYVSLFPEKTEQKNTARKSKRKTHSEEDKTFAIGLSLPLGFPVGDQLAMAFNRNAGFNTISDYIPSPHFQYHFNNKTYVQAGFQFSSPQFIRPILLYQDRQASPGPFAREQITAITARKLYYFNLPLTVYHSPLKNFYMGAGLQYSSLLSGVAQYECVQRSTMGPMQELMVKNYFTKFKRDSLSNRLNKNEVRLLIDMSYYWSRFTVGLQYTQAFNNYASFQVTPNSPYTFDKNKSLQFYLRYNIWEDRKRKQPKGEVLTLK